MMVECVKCRRMRSTKYMTEAVFPVSPYEGAGVYKCSSNESCKQARKVCSKCRHLVRNHVNHENWFGGRKNVVACYTNMGMGDPCGCEEYNDSTM